jgi:hypothetical protein
MVRAAPVGRLVRSDPVYILLRWYHYGRYHGWDTPEVYGTLDRAKQASELAGPWVQPDADERGLRDPSVIVATGDKWDVYIYTRYVSRVPHEPRGLSRVPRCRLRTGTPGDGSSELHIIR